MTDPGAGSGWQMRQGSERQCQSAYLDRIRSRSFGNNLMRYFEPASARRRWHDLPRPWHSSQRAQPIPTNVRSSFEAFYFGHWTDLARVM